METGTESAGAVASSSETAEHRSSLEALSINLLGRLRVTRGEAERTLPASRKARGLLAYLVMSRKPLHRSRLCEIFWHVPNDPRGELRWCLSKLRGILDDDGHKRLRADRELVSIDTSTILVDALAVERNIDAALRGSNVQALERLAAFFQGDLLDGLQADRVPLFETWLVAQREKYRLWHGSILARIVALLPQTSEKRIEILRKRIDLRPDDPTAHDDLLRAFAALGRMSDGDAHLLVAKRMLDQHDVSSGPVERAWRLEKQSARSKPDSAAAGFLAGPTAETADDSDAAPGSLVSLLTKSAAGAPIHNLPPQLTSYIRRANEEEEIEARLVNHRLVTLVGPGGAGKSRLAAEVGRHSLSELMDEIWMIELAPLNDPQVVGETLCNSIGIAAGDSRTAGDSAAAYLRHKRVLLIVDNCEHLIDSVAPLVLALLRACPLLSILATSRERLGVSGESIYQVPGLSLPRPAEPATIANALRHDAIKLFEARAKAAVQDFELSDANIAAVINICVQLDGNPMPIELVVPQLRMVPPHHLATRLRDRVLFGLKGERGVSPRHRTLGALFDWSYNLLSGAEQALFRRLSVFTGTWSLEAATIVASGGEVKAEDIFDLLASLVDKSLVTADLRGPVPRYGFLQTALQYARVKFQESGDEDCRRPLAEFLLKRCVEADATWATTPTEPWLALYEPDLDNLRTALDWAFGPDGDVRLGVELCAYSLRIWDDLALLSERERWFTTAFARQDTHPPPRVFGRLWLGRLSNSAHGDRTNFERALTASEFFHKDGDPMHIGECLMRAGAALETTDATEKALPFLQEAHALMAPFGASKPLSNCLRSLAIARYFVRDFEGARSFLNQSERAAKTVGDLRGVAAVQIAAAELAFAAGATNEAIADTEAMLSGNHCNRRQAVLGITNLVAYLLQADRLDEARHAARQALREARALDWRAAIVRIIEHLALFAALSGNSRAAAKMLGHSIAFYTLGTASREHTELASYDRVSTLLATTLPLDTFAALMRAGADWTAAEAEQRAIEMAGIEP